MAGPRCTCAPGAPAPLPRRWNAASQELYSGSNDCNIVVWAPARERVGAEREPWQQDSDGDVWSD